VDVARGDAAGGVAEQAGDRQFCRLALILR
jgi:hypothetical protein